MRAGLGIGLDGDGAGPQFLRAGAGEIDRGLAIHPRRRRHIGIELIAGNDADAVVLPALHLVVIVRVAGMGVIMSCHGAAFAYLRAALPSTSGLTTLVGVPAA
jgi:hypothetical protein